jgi:hypothetical protein
MRRQTPPSIGPDANANRQMITSAAAAEAAVAALVNSTAARGSCSRSRASSSEACAPATASVIVMPVVRSHSAPLPSATQTCHSTSTAADIDEAIVS